MALVVVATSACGASGTHDAAVTTKPVTTTVPTPTAPATTVPPDFGPVPRPVNATDDAFQWFVRRTGSPNPVLLAVRRNPTPGPHPAVLVIDASGGVNPDYLTFAEELGDRGFDVVVGCLFAVDPASDPQIPLIPCADAPSIMGVVETAVPDLDSVVDAVYDVLGVSTPLAVVGFSRGAGIAALRAAEGRLEPVVLVSGKYEGWSTLGPVPGGEVNVVERVSGWRPPALVLHGTADAAIPVAQAHDFEAALRAAGASVEAHYYDGAGHNLAGEPAVHADLEDRITQFVCARFACAG